MFIDKCRGPVLLVGEANFSFSLSVAKYIDANRITTTCYESREQLEKIHGSEVINGNVAKLNELGFCSVQFGVDATKLNEFFSDEVFERIYFMFPHVSGRSNLRKNRDLMLRFFASCRSVLLSDGAIFVTLAAGQGGTRFEQDASKRSNKDSWTINQLAQNNGFILSACELFVPELFDCYKSTGFRSQSKSFSVQGALVHKFERSLPISFQDCFDTPIFWRFFRQKMPTHPFIQIRDLIASSLRPQVNIIDDKFDLCTFCLDQENNTHNTHSIRKSLWQVIDALKRDNLLEHTRLSLFAGPVLTVYGDTLLNGENIELNNLKYELVLYQNESSVEKRADYENQIVSLFEDKELLAETIEFASVGSEFKCTIDISALVKSAFDLDDIRLLFSDDSRTFVEAEKARLGITTICRAYCLETNKWEHDLSFWHKSDVDLDSRKFLATISETCDGLVRFVRLIDVFDDLANGRRSYCFRLVYESCDRALDWETTKLVQSALRESLTVKMNLVMR